MSVNLAGALHYDPFAGDFGGDHNVHFRDLIVTFRAQHWCHMCQCGIAKGTRGRLSVWKFDGEVITYRWCTECCEAMAYDVTHDGVDRTSERYRLRGCVERLTVGGR